MGEVVVSLLFGLIDPFLWIKSMSTLGVNKSKIKYVGAFVGFYLLIVLKEFIPSIFANSNIIETCLCTFFHLVTVIYVLVVTIVLFEGGIREKILNVCVFFFLVFISELLVMGVFLLYKRDYLNLLFTDLGVNCLCSCVSRILLAIGCYYLYVKRKLMNFFYHSQECILVGIIIIVFDMLACAIIKDTKNMKEIIHVVLSLEIGQIALVWCILYVSHILKQKDRCIAELKQEISDNQKRQELIEKINHLKHDFPMHISMIKNLLHYEQYEQLNAYVDTTFETLENIELLYNHPNITVGILISELKKASQEMQVPFSSCIQVKDFGMKDEDTCCLLKNIIMNGLEATEKVHHKMAHVSLQILYTMEGYEIRCINNCVGMVDFTKTSKKDKENHGYGVSIIHKIVKKNHGTIEMKCRETDQKGIYLVVTAIQIPLEGGGWKDPVLQE